LNQPRRRWIQYSAFFVSEDAWESAGLGSGETRVGCFEVRLAGLSPATVRKLLDVASAYIGNALAEPIVFVVPEEWAERTESSEIGQAMTALIDELQAVRKVNIAANMIASPALNLVIDALKGNGLESDQLVVEPMIDTDDQLAACAPVSKRCRSWLQEIEAGVLNRLESADLFDLPSTLRHLQLPSYVVPADDVDEPAEVPGAAGYAAAFDLLDTDSREVVEALVATLRDYRIAILGGHGAGTDFLANIALTRLGTIEARSPAEAADDRDDEAMPLRKIFDVRTDPSEKIRFELRSSQVSDCGFLFRDFFDPRIPRWDRREKIFKMQPRRLLPDGRTVANYPFGISANWSKEELINFVMSVTEARGGFIIFTTRYDSFAQLKSACAREFAELKGRVDNEAFGRVEQVLDYIERRFGGGGDGVFIKLAEKFGALAEQRDGGPVVSDPLVWATLHRIFTDNGGLDFPWTQQAHRLFALARLQMDGNSVRFGHWSRVVQELKSIHPGDIHGALDYVEAYFDAADRAFGELLEVDHGDIL
jgi:hypothetical protein